MILSKNFLVSTAMNKLIQAVYSGKNKKVAYMSPFISFYIQGLSKINYIIYKIEISSLQSSKDTIGMILNIIFRSEATKRVKQQKSVPASLFLRFSFQRIKFSFHITC